MESIIFGNLTEEHPVKKILIFFVATFLTMATISVPASAQRTIAPGTTVLFQDASFVHIDASRKIPESTVVRLWEKFGRKTLFVVTPAAGSSHIVQMIYKYPTNHLPYIYDEEVVSHGGLVSYLLRERADIERQTEPFYGASR